METPASARRGIPALDGLRGVAILLVVWSHTGLRLDLSGIHLPWIVRTLTEFSYVGVDLFFVLSGFLIFLPYAESLIGRAPLPSAHRFYVRRARRILPGYYAALCVILALLSLPASHDAIPTCHVTLAAVLPSLALLNDLNPHTYCAMFFADGPLWSLTIEWQFYLVLPAVAFGLAAFSRRGRHGARLLVGLGVLAAFGMAVRLGATLVHYSLAPNALGAPEPWTVPYALLFGVNGKDLDIFALGMMGSALYVRVTRAGLSARMRARRLATGAAVAGALGLALCVAWASHAGKTSGNPAGMTPWSIVFPRDGAQWPWAVWGDWTISVGFTCLLLAALWVPSLGRALSFGPLRFLGRISYSVYLWHILILAPIPANFLSGGLPVPLLGCLALLLLWAVVIGWGALCYQVVERPFLTTYAYSAVGVAASRGADHHPVR